MKTAYIGLGSNLGDRAANLLEAVSRLTRRGLTVRALSSIYETEPVDNQDQPAFLNMVVSVDAGETSPFELMRILLEIEDEMGRVRVTDKGPRTIDLDLLMQDDHTVDGRQGSVDLTLPHPRMHLRRFVLVPLSEIAPGAIHPLKRKTIRELLDSADDGSSVGIYRH